MGQKQNDFNPYSSLRLVIAAMPLLSVVAAWIVTGPAAAKTQAMTGPSPANPGPPAESGRVVTYAYPPDSPASQAFKVKAGGMEVFVYRTSSGDFAAFAFKGSAAVEIETRDPAAGVRIAPARHKVVPTVDGNHVRFSIPRPMNLLIEIDGLPQLFLFADAPDSNPPDPEAKGVSYFRAGRSYDAGEIRLRDHETLYIEGGAVVRGRVRATSADGVRIAGRGVLDGGSGRQGAGHRRSILLEGCRNSVVEDIVMIEPAGWMTVLGACRNVTVRNVKELSNSGGTDGVDIVGSSRIRVENCFFRNGDDCIAVKSLDLRPHDTDATMDYTADVEDVEVSGCAFLAYLGGQAMEIGHELRTASIRNIRFRGCDVLGVHGFGAPFGIHNADRATVSGVLYEDIRVEHYYNKLIEFRVIKSRWSKDPDRGRIRDVTLRNIDVTVSEYNPGYSVSAIGGPDAEHNSEQVRFENFRLNGNPALSADDLDLYLKHAKDVTFRQGSGR